MTKTQIIEWLENEFLPVQLATPHDLMDQIVENTFRYWNTNSGYKLVRIFPSSPAIDIDPEFKQVVKVFPTTQTEGLFDSHPLFTLLGIQILDNVTQDLIILSESFKSYRIYTGNDFGWKWMRNPDPTKPGKLFVKHLPAGVNEVAVEGTKRILPGEDIVQEHVLDWVLSYSKALLKMAEGNTLRKSDVIGVKNDGQRQFDEGREERKELEGKLAVSGRWVALAQRF